MSSTADSGYSVPTGMEKRTLESRLVRTDKQIAAGAEEISRLQQRIRECERNGHDTSAVRLMLARRHEAQLTLLATRERLRKDIGALKK